MGIQSFISTLGVLLLLKNQGAGGTDKDTFTAAIAPGFSNWLVTKGSDSPGEATVSKAKDTYTQALLTYPYATPTEHTLIWVVGE